MPVYIDRFGNFETASSGTPSLLSVDQLSLSEAIDRRQSEPNRRSDDQTSNGTRPDQQASGRTRYTVQHAIQDLIKAQRLDRDRSGKARRSENYIPYTESLQSSGGARGQSTSWSVAGVINNVRSMAQGRYWTDRFRRFSAPQQSPAIRPSFEQADTSVQLSSGEREGLQAARVAADRLVRRLRATPGLNIDQSRISDCLEMSFIPTFEIGNLTIGCDPRERTQQYALLSEVFHQIEQGVRNRSISLTTFQDLVEHPSGLNFRLLIVGDIDTAYDIRRVSEGTIFINLNHTMVEDRLVEAINSYHDNRHRYDVS